MPPRRKLRPSTAPSEQVRSPMLPASVSAKQKGARSNESSSSMASSPGDPDGPGFHTSLVTRGFIQPQYSPHHTESHGNEASILWALSGQATEAVPILSESALLTSNIVNALLPPASMTQNGLALSTASTSLEDSDTRDWPTFIRAYAAGQWDPYKTPIPPRPSTFSPRYGTEPDWAPLQAFISSSPTRRSWALHPPYDEPTSMLSTPIGLQEPSSRSSIPSHSPTLAAESLSHGSVAKTVPPGNLPYPIVDPAGISPYPPQSTSPKPGSPSRRNDSIARRRGTDPPDLRGPAINVIHSTPTSDHSSSTRPLLVSSSSEPERYPSAFLPKEESHNSQTKPANKIENTTAAATVRWAGAGVAVAPLSLPSPEYELTDPMRKIALGSSSSVHSSGSTRIIERSLDTSREANKHPNLSSSAPSRVFAASRTVAYTPPSKLESITASPQGSPGEYPSTGPSRVSSASSPPSDNVRKSIEKPSGQGDYAHSSQLVASMLKNTTSISAPLQQPRHVSAGGDYFGDSAQTLAQLSAQSSSPQASRSRQSYRSNQPSALQPPQAFISRPRTPDPPQPAKEPLLPATNPVTHARSDSSGSITMGLSPRSASISGAFCAPGSRVLGVSADIQLMNNIPDPEVITGTKLKRLGPSNIPHIDSPEASYGQLGWLKPPLPPDEVERAKALHKFNILFTARDVNFERIAHLAKLVFNTKMVLVSLIDKNNQWHKAEAGVNANIADRSVSFCGHTILQRADEPMVILDAAKDWRFMNNPLVAQNPNIRFYAGAPLRTADGYNIGTLCVIDDQPRAEMTPRQRHTLKEFAAIVMREMELWRDKIQLKIRDRIQTSMEQFTRECLELDIPISQKNTGNHLDKVYQQAATLVQKTLDVEGAIILDVSNFEASETLNSDGTTSTVYHGDLFADGSGSAVPSTTPSPSKESATLPEVRRNEFCPIPDLKILGSAEVNPPATRGGMITAEDHAQISKFLSTFVDGKIYERVPSCFRHFFPHDVSYAMIVPIFDTNKIPFALLCAYTSRWSMHFLEGYELQYLRAIGVIILSAVLKRRMYLADNSKSLFISNISHELRTPLHGILASAELLGDTRLTSTQSSYLQVIQACGTSLVETVGHVLDYSKMTGNTQRDGSSTETSVKPVRFDLAQLVDETVEGCWIGAKARAVYGSQDIGSMYNPPTQGTNLNEDGTIAHVETVVDIAYRPQAWVVKTDRAGIRRLLINLVSNSMKFTSNGYVQVSLREVPTARNDNKRRIELAVTDTGKGISPDFIQNRLFQPFSQENPLQTGTGLGLAIVHAIIKSLGGSVTVTSHPGTGTEMRIHMDMEMSELDSSNALSLYSPVVVKKRPISVSFVNFDLSIKGIERLYAVMHTYLADWWGFDIRSGDEPLGDIILLHEDFDYFKELVARKEFSRPILVLSSVRGHPQLASTVTIFEKMGGFYKVIFKPCGPYRTKEAFKAAVRILEGRQFNFPRSRQPTGGSTSGLDTGFNEQTSTRSQQIASTQLLGLGVNLDEVERMGDSDVGDYSTALPSPQYTEDGRQPTGYSLSQAVLKRRHSEETRDVQSALRPVLNPRSYSYAGSPLRADGVEHSGGTQYELSPPNSPASIFSLADGGSVMLKSATGTLDTTGERVSVLLVDDNSLNRKLLAQWLKKKGYQYREAVDGQEAVDIFRSAGPGYFDVLLLDLSMPRLDGFQAGAAIRRIETERLESQGFSGSETRCKIFALTGLASIEDKRRAFAVGVDGYLIKPVSFKTLEGVFSRLRGIYST